MIPRMRTKTAVWSIVVRKKSLSSSFIFWLLWAQEKDNYNTKKKQKNKTLKSCFLKNEVSKFPSSCNDNNPQMPFFRNWFQLRVEIRALYEASFRRHPKCKRTILKFGTLKKYDKMKIQLPPRSLVLHVTNRILWTI